MGVQLGKCLSEVGVQLRDVRGGPKYLTLKNDSNIKNSVDSDIETISKIDST